MMPGLEMQNAFAVDQRRRKLPLRSITECNGLIVCSTLSFGNGTLRAPSLQSSQSGLAFKSCPYPKALPMPNVPILPEYYGFFRPKDRLP